jgi:hypothetical protein
MAIREHNHLTRRGRNGGGQESLEQRPGAIVDIFRHFPLETGLAETEKTLKNINNLRKDWGFAWTNFS